MKSALFITIAIFISSASAFAQPAEISRDHNGSKTVKGFLTKQDLSTDTAFIWFAKNQKSYKLDSALVDAFKLKKDSVNIIAFAGTWCDDTKWILPQFFALTDAAGYRDENITLLGVDRDKKTQHSLSELFHVDRVPTFIVMKEGKEIGRVVEFGKTGLPMKELAEVLSSQ